MGSTKGLAPTRPGGSSFLRSLTQRLMTGILVAHPCETSVYKARNLGGISSAMESKKVLKCTQRD